MSDLYLIEKISGWLNTIFHLVSCHFPDLFLCWLSRLLAKRGHQFWL